jgi:transposase
MILTQGTMADCSQALPLIQGFPAENLLADKGYDSDEIVAAALARGINPVIPPKSNRKKPRDYDRDLYKLRHLVENAFLLLKQWRGVATRYAKGSASYLASCQFRALVIWSKLF